MINFFLVQFPMPFSQVTRPWKLPLLITLLLLGVSLADAATLPGLPAQPPGPGTLLREQERRQVPEQPQAPVAPPAVQEPEPPLSTQASGPRFHVTAFHITRITAFPEAELVGLLKSYIDKELSVADLNDAADVITRYYRAHGYFVAAAYIPAQEIQDGIVEISVLEGKLDKVKVDPEPESRINPAVVEDILSNAIDEDGLLREEQVERGLLLLNDLPGINARATLTPGQSMGTSLLLAQVSERPLFSGYASLDNYGQRYSGVPEVGGGANLNDPTGAGDILSARVVHASRNDYGWLTYIRPVGSSGLKLGAALSGTRFSLCCEFSPLDVKGFAEVATVNASYPLLRTRDTSLYGSVAFDAKRLYAEQTTGTINDTRIRMVTFGLMGNHSDQWGGGGNNTYSLNFSLGDLHFKDDGSKKNDSLTRQSKGNFTKTAFTLNRLQTLTDAFSLYGALSGQVANSNLAGSEKFVLGGPTGVRAYPQGEAIGDEGMLLNLELRYKVLGGLTLSAFYDHGEIRQHQNTWSNWRSASEPPNQYGLNGAGMGLTWWSPAGTFYAQGAVAQVIGSNPGSNADGDNADGRQTRTRFWFQIVKYF